MMHKALWIMAWMVALALPVWADSPHYLKADASFSGSDGCYSVALKEAGLGNSGFSSITYDLTCSAAFTVACYNKGGNQVQGQPKNGVSTATTSTVLPIRNGQTNGTIQICPTDFKLPDPGCTGNQIEVITVASYSQCSLDDNLGTPSPILPNLGGDDLFIVE